MSIDHIMKEIEILSPKDLRRIKDKVDNRIKQLGGTRTVPLQHPTRPIRPAGATLETAQFFLKQAEQTHTTNREALENYLSAAIIFGRSAIEHLKAEYKPQSRKWKYHKEDLIEFFLDMRNMMTHDRLAEYAIAQDTSTTATVALAKPNQVPPPSPPFDHDQKQITTSGDVYFYIDEPKYTKKPLEYHKQPARKITRRFLSRVEEILNEVEAKYASNP